MNTKYLTIICLLFFFLSLFTLNSECIANAPPINWNNNGINWQSYNQGISYAKRSNKPIILVIYSNWCPTCQKYGKVFHNSTVVQETSKFVMINVDKDKNPNISATYGFDGEYVPRTIALYPNGSVMHNIYPSKKYRYYIQPTAGDILSLMEKVRSNM